MGKKKMWTEKVVWEVASKYTTNAEFKANHSGAWYSAYKAGYLDEIKDAFFIPYVKVPSKWTKDEIGQEALKYSTRTEFEKGSAGASKAARRSGIMNEVCSHMKPMRNVIFSSMKLKTGLYFLYLDEEIVYVGKSTACITRRLNDHYSNVDKVFDSVVVYEINNVADIHIAEMYFIAKYSPAYNIECNDSDIKPTIEIANINDVIVNEYEFNLGEES